MDAFIEVFTSGDLTKVASFTITFVVVSGVLLCLLIIAKKFGITLSYKGKDGTGFDNNAHIYPPTIEKKTNKVNQMINNGLKELENDSDNFEKKIKEIKEQSDEIWESLYIAPSQVLQEKDIKIFLLEKENSNLKTKIFHLNKELEKYSYLDDPLLLDYKNNLFQLKLSYTKMIKKICLNKKLLNFKSDAELEQYAKVTLHTILIIIGKKLFSNVTEVKNIWSDESQFATQIQGNRKEEFYQNFLRILKKIFQIANSNQFLLNNKKIEIDKKILAGYHEILSKHWDKTFNPKKPETVDEIKKIRNSCKYYKLKSFNSKEIHGLVYSIGMDMIIIYEQVKSVIYDKQLMIAEQFFTNIDLLISISLKEYLIQKIKIEKSE